MKKLAVFLTALVWSLAPAAAQGYSELYEDEETVSLRECADSIAALKDEAATAAFVASHLKAYGVELLESSEMENFGIVGEAGDTLSFRNVVGIIPGFDKSLKSRYIVLGTSLSAENSASLALLLRLASKLSTTRVLTGRSIVVAAFGGASQDNAGSWYFLNRSFYFPRDIDAYISLDFFDNPNKGFYAFTGSNADLNRLIAAVSSELQPARPEVVASEPGMSDLRSFHAFEVPSVMFTTRRAGMQYRPEIDSMEFAELERQGEYIHNFCIALSTAPAPKFKPDGYDSDIPLVYFSECDQKPRFLGSSDPRYFLTKWVYAYLRYPQDALENAIRGKVRLSFVIDEKGKMTDVRVEKGVYPSLDAEAVRVVEASPDWKPGKLDGRPVKTKITVDVEFRLEKK